jgi:hypothetical protein
MDFIVKQLYFYYLQGYNEVVIYSDDNHPPFITTFGNVKMSKTNLKRMKTISEYLNERCNILGN